MSIGGFLPNLYWFILIINTTQIIQKHICSLPLHDSTLSNFDWDLNFDLDFDIAYAVLFNNQWVNDTAGPTNDPFRIQHVTCMSLWKTTPGASERLLHAFLKSTTLTWILCQVIYIKVRTCLCFPNCSNVLWNQIILGPNLRA